MLPDLHRGQKRHLNYPKILSKVMEGERGTVIEMEREDRVNHKEKDTGWKKLRKKRGLQA